MKSKLEKFIEDNKPVTNLLRELLPQFIKFPKINKRYDDEAENCIDPKIFENENFIENGEGHIVNVFELTFAQENINYDKLAKMTDADLHFPIYVTERRDGAMVVEDGYHRILYSLINGIYQVKILLIKIK